MTMVGDRGSAVTKLARETGAFAVRIQSGALRAVEEVIAGNPCTAGAAPWFLRRLVRSILTMAACDARDPALPESLMPADRR